MRHHFVIPPREFAARAHDGAGVQAAEKWPVQQV